MRPSSTGHLGLFAIVACVAIVSKCHSTTESRSSLVIAPGSHFPRKTRDFADVTQVREGSEVQKDKRLDERRVVRRHEAAVIDPAQKGGQTELAEMAFSGGGGPFFEASWSQNVSVVVGQPAVLRCRTRLLGDRMLSFIRGRDLHVLSSSLVSYTSDGRFSVHHQPTSDDWELRISSTQGRDAGTYECQVNTEPKINWPIYLTVHTGQAQIAGPTEVHVREGSILSLTCSLQGERQSLESNLVWYHDGQPILLETAKNSLALATERSENFISLKLLLPRASSVDAGNYTCRPSEALPASIFVHVLSGEHPAAMQHGNRSGGRSCLPTTAQLVSILWLGCYHMLMTR